MKYFAELELERFYNDLDNGNTDALILLGQIKQRQNELNELREYAMEFAINDFDLQPEKSYLLGEYEFSKTAGGRYSYKDSLEWLELSKQVKDMQGLMQDAYRANLKGHEFVNPETGEIVQPATYLHNKESISIKIKK